LNMVPGRVSMLVSLNIALLGVSILVSLDTARSGSVSWYL
jgi:hypothetical protein